MPTPPTSDPRRPYRLAANAARTLGVVCTLCGLLAFCALGFASGGGLGSNRFAAFVAAVVGFYLAVGAVYWYLGSRMKRDPAMWAAICLIVLGSLTGLFVGLAALADVVRTVGQGRAGEPEAAMPRIVIELVVAAVAVLLVVYASQSVRQLSRAAAERAGVYGFAPVMPAAPLPPASAPAPGPASHVQDGGAAVAGAPPGDGPAGAA